MLLAVMDLGSNSFKMTVAQWAPEVSRRKPFRVLHKERYPIQLGASVFSEGRISKEDFKKGVQALRKMQARLRDFASPILRVVATSAIRDAENGAFFVEYVRKELGLNIEVITGREEAALIARGLNIEYPKIQKGLLIDIGGGSTEVASFGQANTKDSLCKSFRIGSVRVASRFFNKDGRDVEKARRYARDCFKSLQVPAVERLVGSAGTIQSLGAIFSQPGHSARTIHANKLEAWINENFEKTPKQIERKFGLRPSRARVIVPGAVVLLETLRALKQDAIHVTGLTLRDGLMIDLVDSWQRPRHHMIPNSNGDLKKGSGLSKNFIHELEAFSSRFHVSNGTARHVAHLANDFYIQLRKFLEKGELQEDFRCLTAASFFYYCGRSISEKDFEKHSSYIIENADLKNMTERERKIVARIVLFARGKSPPAKDVGLWGFTPAETRRIFQLTAIFRLAVTLDEIESENILSADLNIKGDQLLIKLVQKGPSKTDDVEGIRAQFKYFEHIFGLKIVTFVDSQPG